MLSARDRRSGKLGLYAVNTVELSVQCCPLVQRNRSIARFAYSMSVLFNDLISLTVSADNYFNALELVYIFKIKDLVKADCFTANKDFTAKKDLRQLHRNHVTERVCDAPKFLID